MTSDPTCRLIFIEEMNERSEMDYELWVLSQECDWYLCLLWLYTQYAHLMPPTRHELETMPF